MTRLSPLSGYYAVLDRDDLSLARSLLAAGPCALQLRLKGAPSRELVEVARKLRPLAAEAGVPFVVNDRLDVALAAGADALHLGQDDLPLSAAQEALRRAGSARPLRIGISTHNLAQVEEAVRAGADYLGFGPVFATTTKENPDPVQGIEGLRQAVRAAGEVPVVAIGGITPERAPALAAAGAAAACVIGAVNRAPDPRAAGRQIAAAWRSA